MFQIRSFLRWTGEILGAQSVFAARLPVCGKSSFVIETETKEEEKKIIVMDALIQSVRSQKLKEDSFSRCFSLPFFVLFSYLL